MVTGVCVRNRHFSSSPSFSFHFILSVVTMSSTHVIWFRCDIRAAKVQWVFMTITQTLDYSLYALRINTQPKHPPPSERRAKRERARAHRVYGSFESHLDEEEKKTRKNCNKIVHMGVHRVYRWMNSEAGANERRKKNLRHGKNQIMSHYGDGMRATKNSEIYLGEREGERVGMVRSGASGTLSRSTEFFIFSIFI